MGADRLPWDTVSPRFNLNTALQVTPGISRTQSFYWRRQGSSKLKTSRALLDWLTGVVADHPQTGRYGSLDQALTHLKNQVAEHPQKSLQWAVDGLNPPEKEQLKKLLGGDFLRSFLALSRQGQTKLLLKGLLRLAHRDLVSENNFAAVTLLNQLGHGKDFHGIGIPTDLKKKAHQEWEAMNGRGSFGGRLAHQSRTFVKEVLAPAPLIAMAVAAPVYSVVRFKTLAHLIGRPAGLLTRGLASRFLASSAGWGPEVLTFWGVQRAYNQVFHPKLNRWDNTSVTHELLGLGLTFGLFKLNGRLFQAAADDVLKYPAVQRTLNALKVRPATLRTSAQWAGMYSGIVTAGALEGKLGLKPYESPDALFTNSLVTLVQLKSMGAISHKMMGPSYAAWMQGIEAKAQEMDQQPRPTWGQGIQAGRDRLASGWFSGREWMTPEGFRIRISGEEKKPGSKKDHILMMSGKEGRNGSNGAVAIDPFRSFRERAPALDPHRVQEWVRLALDGYLDSTLETAQRDQLGAELYRHEDLVKISLRRLFEEKAEAERNKPPEKQQKIDVAFEVRFALQRIRSHHFYSVIERIWKYKSQFDFLESQLGEKISELGEELAAIPREERDPDRVKHYGELLEWQDSVKLKIDTVERWYRVAESYIADYRGPKKWSPFTKKAYPGFLKLYDVKFKEFDFFIQGSALLEGMAKGWTGKAIPEHFTGVQENEVQTLIQNLKIPGDLNMRFRWFITYDYHLRGHKFLPLYRLLTKFKGKKPADFDPELWGPLKDYLEAHGRLYGFADEAQISNLNFHSKEPQEVAASVDKLIKLAADKYPKDLQKQGQAVQAFRDFVKTAVDLQKTLEPFTPPKRVLEHLSWDSVKGRLEKLGGKGWFKKETVETLIRWFDPPVTPVNSILKSNRKEALAGMMELIFSEGQAATRTQVLSRFINEVCERGDYEMMTAIGKRFYHYYYGALDPNITFRHLSKGNGAQGPETVDPNREFLRHLFVTARFYHENPGFTGSYFEIVRKLHDHYANGEPYLVYPIRHEVKRHLEEGAQVNLLSRESQGTGSLFIGDAEGNNYILGVSSIKEKVGTKEMFFRWAHKLRNELGLPNIRWVFGNALPPVRLVLYLKEFHDPQARKHITQWARDFMQEAPEVLSIQLEIPPKRGSKNFDNLQYFQSERVGNKSSSSWDKIEELEAQIKRKPNNPDNYYKVYELLEGMNPYPELDSEGVRYLFEVAKKFPKHRRIQSELSRVLKFHFDFTKYLKEDRLNDFTKDEILKNVRRRKLERIHGKSDAMNLGLQQISSEMMAQYNQLKLGPSLGTEPHYGRVARFWELALGSSPSPERLPKLWDLDPLGIEVRQVRWEYNPKPLSINLSINLNIEGQLKPKDGAAAETGNGSFQIKIVSDRKTSEKHVVIDKFQLPGPHRDPKIFGHFLGQTMRLGAEFGAQRVINESLSERLGEEGEGGPH